MLGIPNTPPQDVDDGLTDIGVLVGELDALVPSMRSLAMRSRAALCAFERSVPDDAAIDYQAASVAAGAAALHGGITELADLLTGAMAGLDAEVAARPPEPDASLVAHAVHQLWVRRCAMCGDDDLRAAFGRAEIIGDLAWQCQRCDAHDWAPVCLPMPVDPSSSCPYRFMDAP